MFTHVKTAAASLPGTIVRFIVDHPDCALEAVLVAVALATLWLSWRERQRTGFIVCALLAALAQFGIFIVHALALE
jgi:hypothetical protein